MIKIGQSAPLFSNVTAYESGKDGFTKISLEEYKGRWVVLFFYPRDFTFICPTEIEEFAKFEKEFESCNCAILACSTDSEWSHKNWFERDLSEVRYPVLADTTQDVARSYNVLDTDGSAQRGTFIVDPDGILRWMVVSSGSVGRSVKETIRALRASQSGELCPVEWETGEKTLGEAK